MEVKVIEKRGKKATTLSLSWSVNGKRHQESTGLSLIASNTKEAKEVNRLTMQKAKELAREKQLLVMRGAVQGDKPLLLTEYWDTQT